MSVRTTDLVKTYGRHHAIDGLTLETGRGVTGLLGPNGAGKTSLLRIVATVLAPTSGQVRVLGRDVTRSAERLEVRRRLGYMPQEPGFYRSFTTFEFVDYVAILKEMSERRSRHDEVRRVLGLTGLSGVSGQKIRALSGGMRRRLALAQALLGDPELVVLDEPTAGLDPEQRMRFRELVSAIAERHSVLLSTHQTEDVSALCNNVYVMDQGRAVWNGTPAELVATAAGGVWLAAERDPRAVAGWRTGDGTYRNVGVAPPGADVLTPTLEDAYLLLLGERGTEAAA